MEDLSFDEQLAVIIFNTGGTEEPLSVLDEMLKMDNPIHPGWVREVEMTVPPKDTGSGRKDRSSRRRSKQEVERVKEKRAELGHKLYELPVDRVLERMHAERMREQQEDEEEDEEEEEEIDIERVDGLFQGRVKEMPTFRVAVADRSRPHRPQVSDRTERALRAAVQELRPRVPAASFDFDGVLSVFLEELQGRYDQMAIEIKAVEWVR